MNKVAVVTGGSRRIGREIARQLHGVGFDIALHYRRSRDEAGSLAQELQSVRSGSCQLFQADLTDPLQMEAFTSALREAYPAVHALVNNASGFEATPIDDCTSNEFDNMLSSNLKGPYFLIQGLLPVLAEDSSIVNIIDVHAQRPLRNFNVYCAAKAGLASLTRSLALELAPRTRVNGVSPGAILWPEGGASYDEDHRKETLASTPLDRMGHPEDIASTVVFLAESAAYITGQVIVVDGGKSLVG
jgi:pteridine reductase